MGGMFCPEFSIKFQIWSEPALELLCHIKIWAV